MNHSDTIDLASNAPQQTSLRESPSDKGPWPLDTTAKVIKRPFLVVDSLEESLPEHETSKSSCRLNAVSLSRIIEPFFVYWRWWVASLVFSLGLGWGVLLIWPRTYESVAKLQLLVGRESVGLDPSSTTTQTLLMQKTMEEDVNSALELLGSREITQRVVDELGAENILTGRLPPSIASDDSTESVHSSPLKLRVSQWKQTVVDAALSALDFAGLRDPVSQNEYAVIHLQNTVSVFAPRKSSTLIVNARSKSPEMSQAIAQAYTRHFMERHVDVSTTEGSLAFFATQAAQVEADLQVLMQQRSSLLQEHKMASANSRSSILTTQLAAIETTIINSEAQIDQSESEFDDLTRSILGAETEVVSAKQTQPDQAIVGMRNSLYAAELEEKRRAAVYKEGHPLLEQIQQQVLAAREALEKMEQESQSLSTAPNPTRQKLEEDLLRTKAKVVGLSSLLEKSQHQRDLKQNEINDLLKIELQLDQLERKVEITKKSLAILREKEEQARVVDDLRRQRISSVGIAQKATLVEKATSPKKSLIAAAFLLLGLGTGLGLVGLREMSRKTLRNSDDVERWLGQPVLAEIPQIRRLARRPFTSQDMKSRKLAPFHAACRTLQSELLLAGRRGNVSQNRGVTIGILGLNEDSGASLLAAGLAMECSSGSNRHTTLVDLDLQKRTVSRVFGLDGQPGIVEFASGRASQTECVHSTQDHAIHLVGSSSQNTTHMCGGDVKNVLAAIERLTETNDCVIFDLPPTCRPDQVLQLAKELDQLVIVVRAEMTLTSSAARLMERMETVHSNIAGVVLTRSRRYVPKWIERVIG